MTLTALLTLIRRERLVKRGKEVMDRVWVASLMKLNLLITQSELQLLITFINTSRAVTDHFIWMISERCSFVQWDLLNCDIKRKSDTLDKLEPVTFLLRPDVSLDLGHFVPGLWSGFRTGQQTFQHVTRHVEFLVFQHEEWMKDFQKDDLN